MNVYVVPHATEPKFKIGKANDVLDRLQTLGSLTDFNLDESLCIRLPSKKDAFRVETILKRMFHKWNIPFDKKNRYDGDTEQFEMACFPRLVRLLNESADLFDGLPQPLPEAQPRVAGAKVARLQWHESRANAARRRQAEHDAYFRMVMAALSCGIDQISRMGLTVFEKCETPYPSVYIETGDKELFDRACAIMLELVMLGLSPACPSLSRTYVFCSVNHGWHEELQAWVVVGVLEGRVFSREPWPTEYLEILDRIPTSTTRRAPPDLSKIKRGYGT